MLEYSRIFYITQCLVVNNVQYFFSFPMAFNIWSPPFYLYDPPPPPPFPPA